MTAQGVPLVLAAEGSGQRPEAGLGSQVLVSHPFFLLCYSFSYPPPPAPLKSQHLMSAQNWGL